MPKVEGSRRTVRTVRAESEKTDELRQPFYDRHVAWARQRNLEQAGRNETKRQFSKQWRERIEAHLHLTATGAPPQTLAASREQLKRRCVEIQPFWDAEIQALQAGQENLQQLISLLRPSDEECLSAYNKQKIGIGGELIEAIWNRGIVTMPGGESQMLREYRDSLDDSSGGPGETKESRKLKDEFEKKIEQCCSYSTALAEFTETHAHTVKTSPYLDDEKRQILAKHTQWRNHGAKATLPSLLIHRIVFQMMSHRPACAEQETVAKKCLEDFFLLHQSFMWARDPEFFGRATPAESDVIPFLRERAGKPTGVSERIEVLQGVNSQTEKLKQKLVDLHNDYKATRERHPQLPRKIVKDDFERLSKALDHLRQCADDTLARLLLEEAPPDPPVAGASAPASAVAVASPSVSTAVKPKQPSPSGAADADEPIRIRTQDGFLAAKGRILGEGRGTVAEFLEGKTVIASYERRTTRVLGEDVWVARRADEELDALEVESGEAVPIQEASRTGATERQEKYLGRLIALAQNALDESPKWMGVAKYVEQMVDHAPSPNCVERYLSQYLSKLERRSDKLAKAIDRLERAALSSDSEAASPLAGKAADMAKQLREQERIVQRTGLDAAIRIAEKQAPTAEALRTLIEFGVVDAKKVNKKRIPLGRQPIETGQTHSGAKLKQHALQTGRGYLDEYALYLGGKLWSYAHAHYDEVAAERQNCCVMHLKMPSQRGQTNTYAKRPNLAAETDTEGRLRVHYGILRSNALREWIFNNAEPAAVAEPEPVSQPKPSAKAKR